MIRGLFNLEEILKCNRHIIQALEGLEEASLSNQCRTLQESVELLEELRDKFFMNTVAAVPATKACLTGAEKALDAVESFKADRKEEALSALKRELEDLSEVVEELLEKAHMRGTTLT